MVRIAKDNQSITRESRLMVQASRLNRTRFKEYESYRQLMKQYSYKDLDKILQEQKEIKVQNNLLHRSATEFQTEQQALQGEHDDFKIKLTSQ